MNKTICQIFVVILGLFVLLLMSLTYIQGFREDKYAHNPLNSRQFPEKKSKLRSQAAIGGDVLAHLVKGEDGFYDRSYDTGPEAYTAVIGYLSDIYDSAGTERSQNEISNGSDPSLSTSCAFDMVTGKEPTEVSTELTLLPNAQRTAYQRLTECGYVGSTVAIRPSTGEILAMISTPPFNPNDIVAGDESTWQSLNNNEGTPLFSHATQRPLPSGSTFKVLATVTALKQGASPGISVIGAPQITLPDATATSGSYSGSTCDGATTILRQTFAQPCSTAFVEFGIQYGTDTLKDVAKRLGIGETYDDTGLSIQLSTVGGIPDQFSLRQTSIGQRDVSFTLLDNTIITATIANGGVHIEPQIIESVRGADLSGIKSFKPVEAGEAISPEVAGTVTELMCGSEPHPGGSGSHIAPRIGTAEHGVVRGEYVPHIWHIAFALDAGIAAAVVVEDGDGRGQGATGASVAAPVGRAFIDAVEQAGR